MKFETKNKPNLNNQEIYDGEKYGVSFEWLIDKLDEQKAFLLKKNEDITVETYIFTCVQHEKKKKAKDCIVSKVLECPAFNFFIKSVDTYGNCDTKNLIERKLYWFDDKKSNIPNENPQWFKIKEQLDIDDS
tara:strand:+ start:112 stop:507 length:396 start_codon:yes stop_codon:yes gene_type:complete